MDEEIPQMEKLRASQFNYSVIIRLHGNIPVALVARSIDDLKIAWDRITRGLNADYFNEDKVQLVRISALTPLS